MTPTDDSRELGHHIWHEILEAFEVLGPFGPLIGIVFVAGVGLAGVCLWRRRHKGR